VLEAGRASIYANSERAVTQQQATRYNQLISERSKGRPVAHLTGQREFWSLALRVNEHVLVPRPETELLVERALAHIPTDRPQTVLDLGTGSGAIATALAVERPQISLLATDASEQALTLAAQNAANHCPNRIGFALGDWYKALPAGQACYDLIVSNPPYISPDEQDLTDAELRYEPPNALYSGDDGLDAIRTIIKGAPVHLNENGWLLLEHGFTQTENIAVLFSEAGFSDIQSYHDLAGLSRMTEGRMLRTA
jgi:release factor glutamine methyltransferase